MISKNIGFAVAGSIITLLFIIVVNYISSPNYIWSIYPIFAIIWWPLSLYFNKTKRYKLFSVVGSLLVICFLVVVNYTSSPQHPWYLYLLLPVLWWPVSAFVGKKAKTTTFAVLSSIVFIIYYIILNYTIAKGYPWFIYPAFVVLWWPIAIYFGRRKNAFGLSIASTVLTIAFFITVNLVSSPNTIWAVFPIFVVLWWPISVYFGKRKDAFGLSITGTILTITFFTVVNYIFSPDIIWAVYPIFAILWWPLSIYFFVVKSKKI